MIRILLLIILLLTLANPTASQAEIEAILTTNKGAPLVGEPIELTLTVTSSDSIVITTWPDFDRDWRMFSVLEAGAPLTINNGDGTITYAQKYMVQLWFPGEYSTPDMLLSYQRIGEETSQTIEVQPAFFSVPSVLEGTDLRLRPFKPQVWLFYVPPLLIVLLAGGAGLLVFAGYRLWHSGLLRRPVIETPAPVVPEGAPAQVALARLRRIHQQSLPPQVVYAAVADCLRAYIQAQFRLPALDLTTDELMHTVLSSEIRLPVEIQEELQRMLQQADLAKFARYQPTERGARGYISTASKWVRSVDERHRREEIGEGEIR